MLKREISPRFDNKLRFAEDYLLWMEIAATHGSVNRINQPLTILHKPEFGSAGLSSKTWSMYRGEIKALSLLNQKKHINTDFVSGCLLVDDKTHQTFAKGHCPKKSIIVKGCRDRLNYWWG